MQARYFLYPALAVMVGCGSDVAPRVEQAISAEEQAVSTEEQVEKPGGVIPEYQLKTLEKAKNVEGQLQEDLEKRAEQLDNPQD